MIEVRFPDPQFRTKIENGKRYIFDNIRKTWLLLTSEEWVRQNFVNYLIGELKYPYANIAIEKEIRLHELKKRFDILVYDRLHQPWLMVECKASEIPLTDEVLQQVLRYNISVPVNYVVITNGQSTVAWQKKDGQLVLVDQLPAW